MSSLVFFYFFFHGILRQQQFLKPTSPTGSLICLLCTSVIQDSANYINTVADGCSKFSLSVASEFKALLPKQHREVVTFEEPLSQCKGCEMVGTRVVSFARVL